MLLEVVYLAAEGETKENSFLTWTVALLPIVVLILTPTLAYIFNRKKDKVTQEQGMIKELQSDRSTIRDERDKTRDQLLTAQSKILELEEALSSSRIKEGQLAARLAMYEQPS